MDKLKIIINIFLILWLMFCGWQDIRRKEINLLLIGIGFIILFILSILQGELRIWDRIGGFSLGILLLLLNRITRGQIGVGDGIMLCIIGVSFGFIINSLILIYSLFSAALFSIFYTLIGKVSYKKKIPFIPFVFVSSLGVFFFG